MDYKLTHIRITSEVQSDLHLQKWYVEHLLQCENKLTSGMIATVAVEVCTRP